MINETVGNLIQAGAEEAGIIDSGNTLTTAELASAIDRLQRLINRSNIDRALIYGDSYSGLLSLTQNKQSYSIGIDPTGGATADFSIARPTKVTRANLLLSSTIRQPLKVTEDTADWARIRYQQVYAPSRMVYYDRNFSTHGLANLYFYPIPAVAYQWEFWSWNQNPIITATTDTINYPDGYAQYWLYALAKTLCGMFGRQVPSTIADGLADAKDQLASMNSPSPMLTPSSDVGHGETGLYNWLSGQVED